MSDIIVEYSTECQKSFKDWVTKNECKPRQLFIDYGNIVKSLSLSIESKSDEKITIDGLTFKFEHSCGVNTALLKSGEKIEYNIEENKINNLCLVDYHNEGFDVSVKYVLSSFFIDYPDC